MLSQHYSYYLFNVLLAGLPSILGALFLLTLTATLYVLFIYKSPRKILVVWSSLVITLGLGVGTFYNAVYEFEEDPQLLIDAGAPDLNEACGTAWTNWIRGGYGQGGNRCPEGCYRGLTLRKQMRMSGFPPWPLYRREMQCLAIEPRE